MTTSKKTWAGYLFRWSVRFVVALALLIASLVVVLSTDEGNRFFFNRLLTQQNLIQYKYQEGNIWRGVILNDVKLDFESVEIKAEQAKVRLGWRALLGREIHLFRTEIEHLQIISKKPSTGEPFTYPELAIPINLRFDQLNVNQLSIQSISQQGKPIYTALNDIEIHDALWKNTKLTFEQTKVNLYNVYVNNGEGFIDFTQKYPLEIDAEVNIPALNSLNMKVIYASARGSLSEIYGGVATETPDLLKGWVILNAMDDNVPMRGQLDFHNYHLPFLDEEQLLVKQGTATFKGNADGLDIELKNDLAGKNVPQGQYHVQMFTDFVNGLNFKRLNADILSGQLQLTGNLDWQDPDNLKWSADGEFNHVKIPDSLLSQEIQGFLPETLTGRLSSKGVLNQGLSTENSVHFSNDEQWQVKFAQADLKKTQQPMSLDVAWQNINRALPYIVGLNSPQGQAEINLKPQGQDIQFKAQLQPFANGFLPMGDYTGKLAINPQQIQVTALQYQHQNAQLNATANVQLPNNKTPLAWSANVAMNGFNPQLIVSDIPVNHISGALDVRGEQKNNAQWIYTENMDLNGQLSQAVASNMADRVKLTGRSATEVLLTEQGDFKGYQVEYDGNFNALVQQTSTGSGALQFKIAGTPSELNIQQLYHDGVAGKLTATGKVNLSQGIVWDIQSKLLNVKPHYFYAPVQGDISGEIKTHGEWSEQKKQIDIQQFNLTGTLNKQPIRGSGQVSIDVNELEKGLKRQPFQANQLYLSYANNQLQVTGNQNGLVMKVDAGALSAVHPSLRGRIYGELALQRQPQPSANPETVAVQRRNRLQLNSNLAIDQLAFDKVFSVQKLRLQGELPISDTVPSQLVLNIDQLSALGKRIEHAKASLTGTYLTHMLKLESDHPRSTFNIQLAGGFSQNGYWLGQVQKGLFVSNRMRLEQKDPTDVAYNIATSTLKVAKHCWFNQNNRLCFDEETVVSPERASVSVMTKNIEIQDFDAFIPDGMQITGQLNGYAKASWQKGKAPFLDAQLFTRNGVIGLIGDTPEEQGTTLNYNNLSLVAKTTTEGLLLRTNVNTPNIGTGYANVLIHPEQKGMPIDGEVAFNEMQLQVLKPFIADVRKMSGTLSIAGKIQGKLMQPEFYGDLRLKDGIFSLNSVPVDLTNIEVYSAIRQNTAQINGVFNSGKGVATLTGQAGWNQQPYLRLKLKGENLLINQAPQIIAGVNPDINIELLPTAQRLTVDGQVYIPRALINMPENKASAITVSPDVRIVRSDQDLLATLKNTKPWDIRANIELTLGNQVIFQGFDGRIPLAGKLNLTQRGTDIAMRATGAIGVTQKVPISAYGQTLELNRVIARFNGLLLNPTLDIDASKTIQGSRVGLRVLGSALSPDVQIYSDAGLSEQEALNALLTGQISDTSTSSTTTTESFKSDVNNAVAAAGISMGLGGTRALTNQIGRAFGLSGLTLDAQGTGDDTQVSVTGYITPDLYLRYGVGVFTPVNKLTLRYQINRRLYLEASQDTQRAIDLFYNWRF